jgi:hypothetical protein
MWTARIRERSSTSLPSQASLARGSYISYGEYADGSRPGVIVAYGDGTEEMVRRHLNGAVSKTSGGVPPSIAQSPTVTLRPTLRG